MEYFIMGTKSTSILYDHQAYQQYLLDQLSDTLAVNFNTQILSYKQGLLAITTGIAFMGMAGNEPQVMARLHQHTIFRFEQDHVLRRGASRRAIKVLTECYDTNRAQAYATFTSEGRKVGFPMMPYQVEPWARKEKMVLDFLNKHNALKKQ